MKKLLLLFAFANSFWAFGQLTYTFDIEYYQCSSQYCMPNTNISSNSLSGEQFDNFEWRIGENYGNFDNTTKYSPNKDSLKIPIDDKFQLVYQYEYFNSLYTLDSKIPPRSLYDTNYNCYCDYQRYYPADIFNGAYANDDFWYFSTADKYRNYDLGIAKGRISFQERLINWHYESFRYRYDNSSSIKTIDYLVIKLPVSRKTGSNCYNSGNYSGQEYRFSDNIQERDYCIECSIVTGGIAYDGGDDVPDGHIEIKNFRPNDLEIKLKTPSTTDIYAGEKLEMEAITPNAHTTDPFPAFVYNWQYSVDGGNSWYDIPDKLANGDQINKKPSTSFSIQDILGNCDTDFLGQSIDIRIGYGNRAFTSSLHLNYIANAPVITNVIYQESKCLGDGNQKLEVTFDRPLDATKGEKLAPIYISDINDINKSFQYNENGSYPAYTKTYKFDVPFNLVPGQTYKISYQTQITDPNDPSKTKMGGLLSSPCKFNFQYNEPSPAITLKEDPNIINTTGFNRKDGSINIAFNGIGPYTYTWTKDPNNPANNTPPTQPTPLTPEPDWNKLGAGYYTITANSGGCSSAPYGFTITQPDQLEVIITGNTIQCNGNNTGTLTVTETKGGKINLGYTYEWFKKDGNGDFQTTGLIGETGANELFAGFYKVKVKDNASPFNEAWSNEFEITQPSTPLSATSSVTNVTCNGANNGTISIDIKGGTSGYSILWNDGNISNNRTGLSVGDYSYTITDAKGCHYNSPSNITITQPSQLTVNSINQTQPSSPSAQDGSITINATGGTGSYTYFFKKDNITKNYASNIITYLENGTYDVWVQDANGCISSSTSIQLEALKLSVISKEDIKCYGTSTGNIVVKASGGKGSGYNYQWFKMNGSVENILTNEINASLSGITAGTYRVKVNDNLNPVIFIDITLSQPSQPITATVTNTNPNCFGSNDGTAAITTSGGTSENGNYTYEWKKDEVSLPSITTANPNNLSAGDFKVIIKDQLQCSYEITFSLTNPGTISIPLPSKTEVSIYGQNTGAISLVEPTGGSGGYVYKWTYDLDPLFDKSTKDISNLKAGLYTLKVTDSNSCSATKTFEIDQPDELLVTLDETKKIACFGDQNGEITAYVSGGSLNYSYEWYKDGISIPEATNVLKNIGVGIYKVTVTDSNGAVKTAAAFDLEQPAKLSVSLTNQTNVLCYGAETGAIDITINGGTPPYTQQWTKENTNYSTEKNLIHLGTGSYNVTITDAVGHNCTASFLNPILISQPPAPLQIASVSENDLTGFETNNGNIAVTVSGGNPDYQYEWRKDSDPAVIGTTFSINDLSVGTYHLIVKDANDCALPQVDYTITQPDKLQILSLTQTPNTNIYCYGQSSAEFIATVTGGVREYVFEWLNTTTGVIYSSVETITATSTISKASNLGAGNYIVSIKDKKNNVLFGNNTFTITQPEKLAFTYNQKNVSCFGDNTGSVKLDITGGISPYTITCGGGTIDNTNGIILGLSKGSYNITVTDANSCQTHQTIVITEPQNSVYIANQISTPTTGFGLSNGKIDLTVAGGTAEYTYEWTNNAAAVVGTNNPTLSNVSAGTYSVLVTDANGCNTSNSYTVQQPTKPILTETHLQAKCNGLFGSLEAIANGGATFVQNQSDRMYTYKLKNKTTETITVITGNKANFTNITDGDYSLTATDFGGIDSNSIDILFQQPTAITLMPSQTNVKCFYQNDGTAAVTANGGTPPYTYIWKEGTTTIGTNSPTIANLQQGNYSVEVRDNNYDGTDISHCIATANFIIDQPSAPLSISSDAKTNVTGFNLNNGTITVNVTGGTPTYVYTWYLENVKLADKTTSAITGLAPGNYKVVITDANLVCDIEKTFVISEPIKLETTTITTPVKCFGDQNGSLQITASGGIPDQNGFYTYQLFDADKNLLETQLTAKAVFNSRFAGNYYIQVTDANDNRTPLDLNLASPIVLTQPIKPLTITKKGITNATCPNEADGTANITVIGGTPGYSYTLKNVDKNTSQSINNPALINKLGKANYEFIVVDGNACTTSINFEITEPKNFDFDRKYTKIIRPISPAQNWSLDVVMTGGQENYTYVVNNINIDPLGNKIIGTEVFRQEINLNHLLINNLPKNNYLIRVTDNTGCTKKSEVYLDGDVLNVSLAQPNAISCNGGTTSFTASASGGIGFITYQWYRNGILLTNENEPVIDDYGAGAYRVNVIDSDLNLVSSNLMTVTQPDQIAFVANATPVNCLNEQNGVIAIHATGGNGNYQYRINNSGWSNFTAAAETVISGLEAGVYTIYVRDTNGCSNNLSNQITVIAPSQLVIQNPINTPATGYGLSNGSIAITAQGGNGNYTYQWYKNDGTPINQTTAKAINLAAGSYYVVVKDSKQCEVESSLYQVNQPDRLLVALNNPTTTIACNGDNSIQLNAIVTGGMAPYTTYSWIKISNGIESTLPGNTAVSPFLSAGSYQLKVTDANGNTTTSNIVNITQPALIVASSSTKEDVKCFGEANGSVSLLASGDSKNFVYRYKNQTTNYGNWIDFESPNNALCSGLSAGEYTFQIKYKDGAYCTNVPNIIVIIAQPNAVLGLETNKTILPATGYGLSNGSIAINAQGGNGNYTYQWYKNDDTPLNQTTAKAINLAAGSYYVVVRDSKECTYKSEIFEIKQPVLLEVIAIAKNNISCNTDKNGSISAIATGGFLLAGASYTYNWYAQNSTIVLANTKNIDNVGVGAYFVVIMDSNGNRATSSVYTLTQPEALTNTLTADYMLCGEGNDWTITTATAGGTPPYRYIWNTGDRTPIVTNIGSGNYNLRIIDANGCFIDQEIKNTTPAHLEATAVITKPTCFEGDDASIEITPVNGTAPYTYLWSTGDTSNVLKNSTKAGNYSVTIKDVKGCFIEKKYTIENPPKNLLNLGEDVTLCKGQTLTVNMTIPDVKATYLWQSENGFKSNKPIITIEKAGTYWLTITNKLGCQATDSFVVTTDNIDIDATFAASSQVFLNEKFVIVDISNPIADGIEWVLPAEATVVSKNKDFAELSFSKVGEYELTLNTKKGNCTATQTKKIIVVEGEYVNPDSIDLKKNFDIKIYPNPSNGIFTVDVTLDKVMPAHIKVYNLSNNMIIDSKYEEGKDTYKFDFSLNGLTAGIYFVLVESQQGNQLRKIIIN